MSKLEIKYPPGATPLNPDEKSGLIPDYLTTQGELNALEQENILDALAWATGKKKLDILTQGFAYDFHKRMFDRVWKWAGKPRQSDKNIGVHWEQIPTSLGQLFENTKFRIQSNPADIENIAIEFHHRLVSIHAFPNGNGRHARHMTNLLLEQNGHSPFTWGKNSNQTAIEVEGPKRDEYIAALKEADSKRYDRLLAFAKS